MCLAPEVGLNRQELLHNYEELELLADLSFHLGELPTSVFLDYVTNQDADEFDTGYAFGVKLGSAKSAGSWRNIEQALLSED